MSVFSLSGIDFHVRYMAPRKWGLSRGFVFHTNRMETWEEVRPGRLADVWLKCLKTESTNFMEGRRALARTLSLFHGVRHVCLCLIGEGLLFVKTVRTEMCLKRGTWTTSRWISKKTDSHCLTHRLALWKNHQETVSSKHPHTAVHSAGLSPYLFKNVSAQLFAL